MAVLFYLVLLVPAAAQATETFVLGQDVLNLDLAGGEAIASAVLAVWALGWVFRTLIRALNVDSDQPSESDSDSS